MRYFLLFMSPWWLTLWAGAVCCLLAAGQLLAQVPVFTAYQQAPVTVNGRQLQNPWAGGLNSSQFGTIDLNADGQADLVVFDRTTNKFSTFLARDQAWHYAPDLEQLFPETLFWMVLADFDCDGDKDLFTSAPAGIKVYRNIAAQGAVPDFQLFREPVQTLGLSGRKINLKVDVTDIPAITDLDNDGDLDILNFVPAVGGNIEFNKNLSMELYGTCDSLEFEKTTDRWGNFRECGTCNTYLFDDTTPCRVAATRHAGSAILALDLDGDADKEVLLGEVSCRNLVLLPNEGGPQEAVFTRAETAYPATTPVDIQVFPAPFLEDVTFDGKPDLLASPNLFFNEGNLTNFTTSNWLYENTGTSQNPDFSFVKKSFLQDEMLELGEGAQAAFLDLDGDGDSDLLAANRGRLLPDGDYKATFFLFENTGTDQQPAFSLQLDDWLQFSEENLLEIKHQFADLNADGLADLYFSARKAGVNQARLYYLLAVPGSNGPLFDRNSLQQMELALSPLAEPHLVDTDGDGDLDLLAGNLQGMLEHYVNNGAFSFERVSTSAGGLGFNSLRRELSIEVAELTGNGKPELLTGDRSGFVRIYEDFTDDLDGTFSEITTPWYLNQQTGQAGSRYFGSGAYPELWGDFLVAGSTAGGFYLLKGDRSITALLEGVPEQSGSLLLYPNPASGSLLVETGLPARAEIYSTTGQQLLTGIMLQPEKPNRLDISLLKPGLYFLKANSGKSLVVRKFVVE